MALPVPILFFPEGTSTDGASVLPFHSCLFEPAVRATAPVTPATVHYVLAHGGQERDLCWFGDDAFLPHLWKTLRTAAFTAELTFGEPAVYSSRRSAARQTHAAVAAMRSGSPRASLAVPPWGADWRTVSALGDIVLTIPK